MLYENRAIFPIFPDEDKHIKEKIILYLKLALYIFCSFL